MPEPTAITNTEGLWTVLASWRHGLGTSWCILKTCIEERLVYRGDFAFSTLVRFLPIVTQIFLWSAIYATGTSREKSELNGYTYPDMVAYYLLVMVARAFSSMPGLASGISKNIRDGEIKKYLTQPIDFIGFLFWYRVAHKLVYYLVASGPFALVFYLCGDYFVHTPNNAAVWCGFVLSLLMAFLIGFLLECLIGLIGFWFLEVSSLLFIYMMLNYFLSGHMIPLDWLPESLSGVMQILPFKYLAYFPAALFLGKVEESRIVVELLIELGWIVVLLIACRVAYARGLKRYSAFGG